YAGIPLTHRGVARSFTVVTGHTLAGSDNFQNWQHIVHADTLVVLMGVRKMAAIADLLVKYGRKEDTPVAVIQKATYESQQTVVATLGTIAEEAAHIKSPATIVVGELVSFSNDLSWFGDNAATQQADARPVLTNFAV